VSDGFEEFEKDWGEPITRHQLAVDAWKPLNADDRAFVRRAARGYVAHRKSQKRPPNVISAHLFIRDRGAWPGWAARAPDAPATAASADPERPWITLGSDEDRVAEWLYQLVGLPKPFVAKGEDGRLRYRARRPLGADAMAMLDYVGQRSWGWKTRDEGSDAPPERVWLWQLLAVGTGPFAAWQKRFRDWTGAGLPIERDGDREGIRMPRPWPPRVNGTWSDDAEPQAAEADDIEDFR
jgi:hypothetical protein